jgi:glycosyltransferase involved in cell wall biosynthesis
MHRPEHAPLVAASSATLAYVTTIFPTMTCFLENEVRMLLERGVRVRVFTLRRSNRHHQAEHEPLVGLTTWLGPPGSLRAWASVMRWAARRPWTFASLSLRMMWASRGSAYALAGHIAYLPAAARLATLVERENVQHLHGAWAHFPASVALLAARLTRRTYSMAGHAGSDLRRTDAFLESKVRAARFVVTCVESNARLVRRLTGPGADVECIYHGVDLARFDGEGREPAPFPLLLSVGRLVATKGFDLVVRALADLARRGHRPRWVLVGDGPERAGLQRLAASLGVAEQVRFAGEMPQPELVFLYRRAWMLVAPSRELPNGRCDGIPNVIVEAMAMGVPCVGARAGGLEEAVRDGVTGRLCQPDNPEGLAATVEEVMASHELRETLGRRGRLEARQRFDSRCNFERLFVRFRPLVTAGPVDRGVPPAPFGAMATDARRVP